MVEQIELGFENRAETDWSKRDIKKNAQESLTNNLKKERRFIIDDYWKPYSVDDPSQYRRDKLLNDGDCCLYWRSRWTKMSS